MAAPSRQSEGRLLVFDVRGRPVESGVYFMRHESGEMKAAGKVVIVD